MRIQNLSEYNPSHPFLLFFLLSGVQLVRGVFLSDWSKSHPGKKFCVSEQPGRWRLELPGICWLLQHAMPVSRSPYLDHHEIK